VSGSLWVVRAGEGAKFADEFIDEEHIAVGFDDITTADLSTLTEPAVRMLAITPGLRNAAGQLCAFSYKIATGDQVIVPRLTKKHRDYLVGTITGPYRHVPHPPTGSGHHQLPVRWDGAFPRTALSPGAKNTLGAIQTIFRPTAVEPELRNLLTALTPIHRTSPAAVPPGGAARTAPAASPPVVPSIGTFEYSAAQLDVDLDKHGRARITCQHPALILEQAPRHIDPSKDWSGVPGIYVLTGTVLEQQSVRTGHERTLTTTSIVRPWAYVGLSEDFLNRLGSHRQNKPEWRRALLVRSGSSVPFSSDDIRYLEEKVHSLLSDSGEVALGQATPRGNLSAQPRNLTVLDACADIVVAVLRLTGTLI
jgi:hypothetical protein